MAPLCMFAIFVFIQFITSETVLLPLTHSLSSTEFNNTHHHVKSIAAKSAARHRHHALSLPLSPGGDYTLSLSIGQRPSQAVALYMDTGSDLVWFPCHPFQCILCEHKTRPSAASSVNVTASTATLIPCKSPACAAAHPSQSSSDLCAIATCPLEDIETSDCASFPCPPFYYAYGDGSLIARLYNSRLSVPASPSFLLPNFTFGCAHSGLAEPVGVAGFGPGILSLPAQLADFSPPLGGRFSYCLVSHSFDPTRVRRPSPLILGKYHRTDDFVYATMLSNPKHPYLYSVGLHGISVVGRFIPAPAVLKRVDSDGNGGMVVDSGTTFTMLPAKFFKAVATELGRRFGSRRATSAETRTGLGRCYHLSDKVGPLNLVLAFGENSSVVLPRRNFLYEFFEGSDSETRKIACLTLMDGGDEPYATLGNYQQQGFEVLYDLDHSRVGFARRKCSSLWGLLKHA